MSTEIKNPTSRGSSAGALSGQGSERPQNLGTYSLSKMLDDRYFEKLAKAPVGSTVYVYFRTLSAYDVPGTPELDRANRWMKDVLEDLGWKRTGRGWLEDKSPKWKSERGCITGWEYLWLFEYKKVR